MDHQKLNNFLLDVSHSSQDPAGKEYRFLSVEATAELAVEFKITGSEIELAALQLDIIPERYQRNIGTIGATGQRKLLQSAVAVVGNGGLGGFVIEMLNFGYCDLLVIWFLGIVICHFVPAQTRS